VSRLIEQALDVRMFESKIEIGWKGLGVDICSKTWMKLAV
jgi:hypothetical protein